MYLYTHIHNRLVGILFFEISQVKQIMVGGLIHERWPAFVPAGSGHVRVNHFLISRFCKNCVNIRSNGELFKMKPRRVKKSFLLLNRSQNNKEQSAGNIWGFKWNTCLGCCLGMSVLWLQRATNFTFQIQKAVCFLLVQSIRLMDTVNCPRRHNKSMWYDLSRCVYRSSDCLGRWRCLSLWRANERWWDHV